ncbi:hypothetical protein TWF281_011164 [Arthrobotrys megalospora]
MSSKLFKSSSKSEPILPVAAAAAATASSNASQRVLNIPELLKPILEYALQSCTTDDIEKCRKANQFRCVSKLWRTTVDSSQILTTFAFRTPFIPTEPGPTRKRTLYCEPYLSSIQRSLEHIIKLKRTRIKKTGLSEFKKALNPDAKKSTLSRRLGRKPKPSIYLTPDIYITRPTANIVSLKLYGRTTDSHWVGLLAPDAQITRRPVKGPMKLRPDNTYEFTYDYGLGGNTGVAAKDLMTGLNNVIELLFITGQNGFKIDKIELSVNDALREYHTPQWNTRTLWESKMTAYEKFKASPGWKRFRNSWVGKVLIEPVRCVGLGKK